MRETTAPSPAGLIPAPRSPEPAGGAAPSARPATGPTPPVPPAPAPAVTAPPAPPAPAVPATPPAPAVERLALLWAVLGALVGSVLVAALFLGLLALLP